MADAWQMLLGIGQATSLATSVPTARAGSVPLTLITGFLGVGKTTLVKRMLTEPHGMRIAVIVNDFGAVNIDAALIRERGAETMDLTNGCICCTLTNGFTRTLIDLVGRAEPPEHIVLEASGVAEPNGIIHVALSNRALAMNGVVCLVDADAIMESIEDPMLEQPIARQAACADLVVLNKADIAGAAKLNAAHQWVKQKAPRAGRIEAKFADVPASIVLGLPRRSGFLAQEVDGASSSAFESFTFTTGRPIDEHRICALVEQLPYGVMRVKGILRLASISSSAAVLQATGRRWSLEKDTTMSGPAQTEIVVIGLKGTFDASALLDRLRACEEK